MPTHDVRDLMTWLSDYHEKLWDAQIENDLEAGRAGCASGGIG